MPSARVFGPWPEHSNPAASCLQWSCALQAEAVDTFFFFACAHLTRGRCCTSNLIAPPNSRDGITPKRLPTIYLLIIYTLNKDCIRSWSAHARLGQVTRKPPLVS